MRRVAGPLMVGAGVLCLVLAGMLRWYIAPAIAMVPLDRYQTATLTGVGTYFSVPKLAQVHDATIKTTTVIRGDVRAGNDKVAVWDVFTRTEDGASGELIHAAEPERAVFHRRTGAPVHCCGEDPRFEGLVLKFPFGTKTRTYDYWDTNGAAAFPLKYARTTTVEGLTVYEFRGTVPAVKLRELDVPGSLVGRSGVVKAEEWYDNPSRVFYVEPLTGAVVKVESTVRRIIKAKDGTKTVTGVDVRLTTDDATVKAVVDETRDGVRELVLTRRWVPLGFLVVGLPLLLAGLVVPNLAGWTRRRRTA